MSKHWSPKGKIVRSRARGRWVRAQSYVPHATRSRSWPVLALVGGAVVAGLAGGGLWSLADTAPVPVATEAPKIVLPYEQVDPADAEWESRDVEVQDGPSTLRQAQDRPSSGRTGGGGARVAFGLCHSGGGSNCVVDGDTFYIGGAKVRIAGIDTPKPTRRAVPTKPSSAPRRPPGCTPCSIPAR